ncbi:BREX-1 system adenine-specific DNA-methyltransferase PglX [Clostridium perfringens]|uniref:BREX-1 system adenine-specific DNA-methyltransferase PglX n=1 Tax=Clostridium perfringens TaxID=1502 RepID=UPI0032DB096E|nr:BREX-1 system adenine-specific DNA-methyltransferase PglX [Clostridium perfringens]
MRESLNKTLLKKFAIESRNELREKIALKASVYGITKELSDKDRKTKGVEGFTNNDEVVITTNEGNRTLSNDERSQRTALIEKIQRINKEDRDGFNEVIEEVAYTWFNRFVALRYMEVNGYLPSRIKILASSDNTNTPEVLTEAMNVSLPIDKNLVYELKKDNKNEELYKYLIELQCSELNKTLPFMFEKIGHFAELLFPAGIITSKFFRTLVDTESITEDAWSNVEIIGWLYQYYISEEKDRVIKAKKKYKKNEIPFATQLFTPDWIVRYMVQNSLGRYWVESHEEDIDLKENWEFYLENPEKEADFDKKIAPYINKDLNVEDIKCFDPACGSGHILVYMFDVLYEIYSKCGYSRGEIPMLIIEKNLYGLDIDMRAYQLACFAVIMKGMSYDKLLLRKIEREFDLRGKYIDLNIACVKETNILFEDENTTLHDNIAFLAKEQSGKTYDKIKLFVESLKNANTFGSLTKVEGFDREFLENRLEEIKNNPATDIFSNKSSELWISILEDLIKQSSIMEKTYDVLVTNPPYIGNRYMTNLLSKFIKENNFKTKLDLFSAFIEYTFGKVKREGHLGFMCPFVWMFITSYYELRKIIVNEKNISSLIQLEYSAFQEATVPICTFTVRNSNLNLSGEYIKLSNFSGANEQPKKVIEAISKKVDYRYNTYATYFKKIPEMPIAYWVSEEVRGAFSNTKMNEIATPKVGLQTGSNEKFLRIWQEVKYKKIGFGIKNTEEAKNTDFKWFPYNKGGDFKKWYGNNDYVVNWQHDGQEIKGFKGTNGKIKSRPQNKSFYFKEGITWSDISSSYFGVRYTTSGFIFDVCGSTAFPSKENIYYITAFLCSKLANDFLAILNPTMHFQVGNISNLPIIITENEEIKELIELKAKENIKIAENEWNSCENSWDFKRNPLISGVKRLSDSFEKYSADRERDFERVKINEEEINALFINIYGLENEFEAEVSDKYITLKKENLNEDIKSLLSYFIGCVFGRYSLDEEGLILAGEDFDITKYNKFMPDSDNIIPVLNSETNYFEDDVMVRFEEFLKIAFSEEYLAENIDFIAEAIGKKSNESSREAIRRYFANEFFTEHCKMYKKRPIYWLFTSGKNKAFNCLVYQHRIDKNLLSKMRIDYVQPLQNKLDIEFKDLTDTMNSHAPAKDKKDAKKKLTLVEKQIAELKVYQEKLKHMADKQIELDLDNGVIHNHGLFGELVAKIK